MKAQAKTINLLLYDGSLEGVISMAASSWNSGILYASPRESVRELFKTEACDKYGVYLLLSSDMVYVGQSSDLAKRLKQHLDGKKWWETVIILTTTSDSLTRSDIDFLESRLIKRASDIGRLDRGNKNKGNDPKVSMFRQVALEQYLEEAMFLMELIGVDVLSESSASVARSHLSDYSTASEDVRTRLLIGKRAERIAQKYVEDQGIALAQPVRYASLQASGEDYWANPRTYLLQQEWTLLLNDNLNAEILVLRIPANTLHLDSEAPGGLITRSDNSGKIQLRIRRTTLQDSVSGVDFARFLTHRISY